MAMTFHTIPTVPRKAVAAIINQLPQHDRAACLDRLADSELAVGRHAAAERLSHAAAAMREASR
jgi:hypothetical protein